MVTYNKLLSIVLRTIPVNIYNFSSSTSAAAHVSPFPNNILFDDGVHTYEYIDNFNVSSPTSVISQDRHDHCIGIRTEKELPEICQESADYHRYAILEPTTCTVETKSNEQ